MLKKLGAMFRSKPRRCSSYKKASIEDEHQENDVNEEIHLQTMCSEECEHLEAEREWGPVFKRLDQADGVADGRIDRRALVKWVSALDLQKTIEFEANLNITPRELERLVSKADANKDGFVDRCEFLRLVANRDKELTRQVHFLDNNVQISHIEISEFCPTATYRKNKTIDNPFSESSRAC